MLTRRRLGMLAAVVLLWGAFLAAAAHVLGAGGWTMLDAVLFVLFAIATPWAVLGFCNAAVGLWLLHGANDALGSVAPFLAAGEDTTPLTIKTAVLMTLRNEDPERAIARLKTVKASLDATGHGAQFSFFLLSDTTLADVAAREEQAVEAWKAQTGADAPPHRLSPPRREYRIQGGQRARLLRALGR